nr:hypothetical protein [Ectobacillus panaciterrae]
MSYIRLTYFPQADYKENEGFKIFPIATLLIFFEIFLTANVYHANMSIKFKTL